MTHDDILNINPANSTDDIGALFSKIQNDETDEEKDSASSKKSVNNEEQNPKEKLILVKQTLEKIQKDLNRAFKILEGADTNFAKHSDLSREASRVGKISEEEDGRVIEGVFDGQNMIGPDGKQYSIPANYSSKSKLVEGDILKLTIKQNGTFVYKQIGPKDRDRLKGILVKDEETGDFIVLAEGKKYKILLASITYFKGEEGDEVIILTPEGKKSAWAAVENIVKNISKKDIYKNESDGSKLDIPKADPDDIDDIGI